MRLSRTFPCRPSSSIAVERKQKRAPWIEVCLCLLLISSPISWAADLRVGFAKVDITPSEPVTLSGYESRKDVSLGVHDPLSARAVAFEKDGHRIVLVSTDIIAYYNTADRMRAAILEAVKLEPAELFLSAIHTHSAPTVTFDVEKGHSNNVAYSKVLEQKLVSVVRAALAQVSPMRMAVGSGSCPIGANRREAVKDSTGHSKIVLGRNPAAPIDREVQVLKFMPPNSNQIAGNLFVFGSHSTSLGPKNYLISGDIHGLAEQFLERYLGPKVIAAGFAGASGDIDPWFRVLPEFKTTNGWIPEPVLLSTLLGEEVVRVLDTLQAPIETGPIHTRMETLALPGKTRTNELGTLIAPPVPFNITVGHLGPVAFVGLGGEVFNEIGRNIKNASPFATTLVITHCNGAAGYLPTIVSYPADGYEVQSSPFAAGAVEMVADKTLQMLQELAQSP